MSRTEITHPKPNGQHDMRIIMKTIEINESSSSSIVHSLVNVHLSSTQLCCVMDHSSTGDLCHQPIHYIQVHTQIEFSMPVHKQQPQQKLCAYTKYTGVNLLQRIDWSLQYVKQCQPNTTMYAATTPFIPDSWSRAVGGLIVPAVTGDTITSKRSLVAGQSVLAGGN